MPERFLALCQFDISFEGFWNFAWIFQHQAVKSCVFSGLVIFLSPEMALSICEGWTVPGHLPTSHQQSQKSSIHSVNCCSHSHLHLEQHLWLVPGEQGWGSSHPSASSRVSKFPGPHGLCGWVVPFWVVTRTLLMVTEPLQTFHMSPLPTKPVSVPGRSREESYALLGLHFNDFGRKRGRKTCWKQLVLQRSVFGQDNFQIHKLPYLCLKHAYLYLEKNNMPVIYKRSP
jgi:hypothetical protein